MENKKAFKIIGVVLLIAIIAVIVVIVLKNRDNRAVVANPNQEDMVEEQNKDVFVQKKENGEKENISEKIKNAKFNIKGLEIKNIKLSELAGKTTITADVFNASNEKQGDIILKITLLDKEGKNIIEIGGYIGTVEAGAASKINASATLDYANAYDIRIEEK